MNLIEQGSKQLQEGDFEKAIESFTNHLKSDELNPNVLCLRGVALRKAQKFNESLLDFQKAANLIPTNASVYSEIAVTQFHLKQLASALANMNKAQELEPQNPYRYSSRAYIKDACGDLDGAIADYRKCIELDPKDAVAHNNLGMLEEKLGRKQKAEKHFQKADEISKDEESPFFGKFNAEGEQVMDQNEAQKEVQNVIKEAQAKEAAEQKQELDLSAQKNKEEQLKPSIGEVMFSVFKSKQEFKSFIQFIKNGFKS